MKNTFKLFGIIAITAVIAFSMTACDLGDPGDDGIAKTLVITNIPSTYDGKQITVAIANNNKKGDPNIVALNQVNSKSNVEIPLLSGNEKKKGEKYTGTGSYYIFLFFDVPGTKDNLNDDITFFYTGSSSGVNAMKYDIKDAKSTISFNLFASAN